MKTEHDWREAMTEVNSTPAVYHLSSALKSAVFNRLTPAAAKAHRQAQIAAMQAKQAIPGPFDPATDSGLSVFHTALIEQVNSLSDETFKLVAYERLQSLGYEISIDAINAIQEALKASQKPLEAVSGVVVELPTYTDDSIPQGTYTLAVGKLSISVLQVEGKESLAWANHPEILKALGIANTIKQDGQIVLNQGLRVSETDSTVYQPSALALIKGIQNGIYKDTTISKYSEKTTRLFN